MFRELQSIWRLYIHITYVSLRQGPQNELLRKQGVTASSARRHTQGREAVRTGQQKQGCHLTGLHFQVPATQETEVVTVQIQCLEPPAHGIHTAHRYAQTLHQGNQPHPAQTEYKHEAATGAAFGQLLCVPTVLCVTTHTNAV